MVSSTQTIRVRYDEVDKMGYVYHGNYAKYFHMSRTSLMRKIGICDKTLESQNIIMPVIEINIKYLKPVFYDDQIRIKTYLNDLSGIKLTFHHLVLNEQNEVINRGKSQLVFVDSSTRKPIKIPHPIAVKLQSILNK